MPDKGAAKAYGLLLSAMADADKVAIAHLGVAYCPEERGIFSSLNVRENLLLPPTLKAAQAMQLDEIYGIFPQLRERAASPGTSRPGTGNPSVRTYAGATASWANARRIPITVQTWPGPRKP